LHEKSKGGKAKMFRFLACHQMDKDRGGHEGKSAEKLGVKEGHKLFLKCFTVPSRKWDELQAYC
jgi:hypothetical protein